MISKIINQKNIIWNIRYSKLEIGKSKLTTIMLIKFLAKLSKFIPKSVVVVSNRSKKMCVDLGYPAKKLHHIPNGYDFNILKIEPQYANFFRKNLKLKRNIPILGIIARNDQKKDHKNFIKALSILKLKKIKFHSVFVGSNINKDIKIKNMISKYGLNTNVSLYGRLNDINKVMNGIDINVQSSSYGEGFPNTVAESMACGTPSVVTNVGDAAIIVGSKGWVVPPNESLKLANAIHKAIIEFNSPNWGKRKIESRELVKKKFGIELMINSYNNLWNKII